MPLHRLTVPSYFGGLPGTHDYINDPAANGDPGVPAPADGKKAAAPAPGDQNEGTYFVAFKEPAQAINVNRPAQALAENTDFLDDIVHRDIAVPTYIDVAAGHGGTNSIVIPGDVWVGGPGTVGTLGTLQALFQFVDPVFGFPLSFQVSSGPPPVYSAPATILIHDGSLVDQAGNDFVTDPTLLLFNTIPDTVAFRILYSVRGRLKDMPAGSLSGLTHWPVGLGFLKADVSALSDAAARIYTANTFEDDNTFQSTVNLEATANLQKPAATAAFKSTVSTLKRILIEELRVNESPDVYFRIYALRDSGGTRRGLELTYNARYTSDSLPEWASDSTSTNYHPTRYRFLGAGVSFTGEGFFYEVLDNAGLGAGTWNETVWSTSAVRNSAIQNGAFVARETRSAVPILDVPVGVSSATDDASENPYKLLLRFNTTGVQQIRVYAGNDDDAAGTGGLGQLVITHNAVWNPSTLTWSQDVNTQSALAFCFRTSTNPNPGISGLSGSTVAGSDSHGGSAVVILVKNPTGGTWTGQQWTKASGNSGHLRIAGEYGYASSIGGKEMRYLPNPGLWTTSATDWARSESLPTTGLVWSGIVSGSFLYIPLELPYGAKITGVSADVDPSAQATVGNRMKIELFEWDAYTLTGTLVGSDTTDGTTTAQSIGFLPTHYVADDKLYIVRIRHALAGSLELVYSATITYVARVNAPGPGQSVGFTFVP